MKEGKGKPEKVGTYVAEVYFGWKLLDWDGSQWWHLGKVGHWSAGDPLQWVGPLPKRLGKDEQWYMKATPPAPPKEPEALQANGSQSVAEYDL